MNKLKKILTLLLLVLLCNISILASAGTTTKYVNSSTKNSMNTGNFYVNFNCGNLNSEEQLSLIRAIYDWNYMCTGEQYPSDDENAKICLKPLYLFGNDHGENWYGVNVCSVDSYTKEEDTTNSTFTLADYRSIEKNNGATTKDKITIYRKVIDRFCSENPGVDKKKILRNVLCHEIGHSLGLGDDYTSPNFQSSSHNYNLKSVMTNNTARDMVYFPTYRDAAAVIYRYTDYNPNNFYIPNSLQYNMDRNHIAVPEYIQNEIKSD